MTSDIIVVFDESGSMKSMGDEPLEAVNQFLTEQKKEEGNLTLYTFSTNMRVIYEELPLKEFDTFDDYFPGGTTKLYDTIEYAISNKMEGDEKRRKNVILVIITDGFDNASTVSCEEIKRLIKRQEDEYNWQVIFLASNQNAFSSGVKYGCKGGKCVSFTNKKGDFHALMRGITEPISLYRSKTKVMEKPEEIVL